jgi:hypothetical protein
LDVTFRIAFLVLQAGVLLLHLVGLPANWILLGLALVYALTTHMQLLGWGTLVVLAVLAAVAEGLEALVGPLVVARRGGTRHGVLGAFIGGIAGALIAAPVVPPFGSMVGAFAGSFAGATLLEYRRSRDRAVAVRAGKAAFLGRVIAAAVKTQVGSWMWCVLAYRLLFAR